MRNNEQASVARDPLNVLAGKRVARKVVGISFGPYVSLLNPENVTGREILRPYQVT